MQARGHELELLAREKALAEALATPVGLFHENIYFSPALCSVLSSATACGTWCVT